MHASRVALFALALSGCGGPTTPSDAGSDATAPVPHATLAWQVRCEAMGGCTLPPARTIDADDGVGGHAIACDVTSFDGTSRILTFDAELAGAYGIHVSNAIIPLIGGRVTGDACEVRVIEPDDGNLTATCSANLPTTDAPCQIQRLTLDAGVLAFQLRCEEAPLDGSTGVLREVGPTTSIAGYVDVTVTGCTGL